MIGIIKSNTKKIFIKKNQGSAEKPERTEESDERNSASDALLEPSSRKPLRAEAQSFEPGCFTEKNLVAYTKRNLSAEAAVYVPDHLLPARLYSFPADIESVQDFHYAVPAAGSELREEATKTEETLPQQQDSEEKLEGSLMIIKENVEEIKESIEKHAENSELLGKNIEETEEFEETVEKTCENSEKTSENSEKTSENSENASETPQSKNSPKTPPNRHLTYDYSTITSLYHLFSTHPSFHHLPPQVEFFSSRAIILVFPPKSSQKDLANSSTITWRRPKTIEEEKILNQAKIYQQKLSVQADEQLQIQKKIRSTLNKLSPNNIEKLSLDLLETCKLSYTHLKQVVSEIFEKAWSEKKYTQMYSDLCNTLKTQLDSYSYPLSTSLPKTRNYFKYELLYTCEQAFLTLNTAHSGQSPPDSNKTKLKTLGSVRFIGELFNVNLIPAKIVLECVNTLLTLHESEKNEDKLEGACELLLTGAGSLEKNYLKQATNKVYQRLEGVKKLGVSTRVLFKILDLEELRAKGWKGQAKEVPKKVEDLHAEFYLEQGRV